MKISVAICTWNRADLLDQTLKQMCSLVIPAEHEWELLVVNNNCTDQTDAVIANYAARLPLCRLFESTPGQVFARNLAIQHASGDLLLWTDDDVLVDPTWLAEYASAAAENPEFCYFGGVVNPWLPDIYPAWVMRHLEKIRGAYALKNYGGQVRPLWDSEWPVGASMGFRMTVQKANPFDTNTGRIRDDGSGGDDIEICKRLKREGYKGLWVGRAQLRHYMHPERLTVRYLKGWFRANAKYTVMQAPPQEHALFMGYPRWMLKAYCYAKLMELVGRPMRGALWIDSLIKGSQILGFIDADRRRRQQSKEIV